MYFDLSLITKPLIFYFTAVPSTPSHDEGYRRHNPEDVLAKAKLRAGPRGIWLGQDIPVPTYYTNSPASSPPHIPRNNDAQEVLIWDATREITQCSPTPSPPPPSAPPTFRNPTPVRVNPQWRIPSPNPGPAPAATSRSAPSIKTVHSCRARLPFILRDSTSILFDLFLIPRAVPPLTSIEEHSFCHRLSEIFDISRTPRSLFLVSSTTNTDGSKIAITPEEIFHECRRQLVKLLDERFGVGALPTEEVVFLPVWKEVVGEGKWGFSI